MRLELDHLAMSAATLEEGVEAMEAALGVALAPGGKHALMGTHNRLLGLAEGLYLEVIAIDPDAPPPAHARWFDLDRFSGPPRLTNWICRTDDLPDALRAAPPGVGAPLALTRGDLRWQMAVPQDGILPFDGAFPALIAWQGQAHPAAMLPASGCRLRRLEVIHPQAEALEAALAPLLADGRVRISAGQSPGFAATFDTPHGPRCLS